MRFQRVLTSSGIAGISRRRPRVRPDAVQQEAALGWRSEQSYSQNARDRVLGVVDSGTAVQQAAARFGVGLAYIYEAPTRRSLIGACVIHPNRGHHPRKLSPDLEQALAAHMRSQPGVMLAQALAWPLAEQCLALGAGATWHAVRRLGLS